jgi:7,8-dihydropterin-6-yl-methyl-4-(beta-D-ribofuranosyl)aminobenzene 5'-phosphate synthase
MDFKPSHSGENDTMETRIVTLVEDSPGSHKGLRSEHGLSFYFDTGQSADFLENAGKLNIDLATLDCVCISHGHYDHSGGVRHLITAGIRSPLVVGKGFFEEKYTAKDTTYEYVGNDFDERFLRNASVSFREIDQSVEEIIPDCSLICQIEFQEILDRQVEQVLKGEISINDVA